MRVYRRTSPIRDKQQPVIMTGHSSYTAAATSIQRAPPRVQRAYGNSSQDEAVNEQRAEWTADEPRWMHWQSTAWRDRGQTENQTGVASYI